MNEEKHILIFSGYNPRAIVAFLRTLEKLKLPYYIVAKGQDDFIFKTEYREKVIVQRRSPQLEIHNFIEILSSVKEILGKGSLFIAPTSEALNRFLIENRQILEEAGAIIPLCDKKLYQVISDKLSFSDLCRSYGIDIPEEMIWDKVKIPFVAKPKRYEALEGTDLRPCLIMNEQWKKDFSNRYDVSKFYFQEYLEGKSLYLLYYFFKNGQVLRFSQQNIAQQSGGGSIVAAFSADIHETSVSEKYEKMFLSLGFHGLVMIEVRKTRNCFKMIEANPRFWGPSQLFVDAGVNFFEALLYDHGIINDWDRSAKVSQAKYFWHGGIGNEKNNLMYFDSSTNDTINLENWVMHDVYRRNDTIDFYEYELNG